MLNYPAKWMPILLPAVLLAGCETPSNVPVTDLRPWKTISYSCADTKSTRDQVIEHNNRFLSLKAGRKVIYGDTCPKEAKTS